LQLAVAYSIRSLEKLKFKPWLRLPNFFPNELRRGHRGSIPPSGTNIISKIARINPPTKLVIVCRYARTMTPGAGCALARAAQPSDGLTGMLAALQGGALVFWESAARFARSALLPELASLPIPRLSARAPVPSTLALRLLELVIGLAFFPLLSLSHVFRSQPLPEGVDLVIAMGEPLVPSVLAMLAAI
jgi:hypothetical protein